MRVGLVYIIYKPGIFILCCSDWKLAVTDLASTIVHLTVCCHASCPGDAGRRMLEGVFHMEQTITWLLNTFVTRQMHHYFQAPPWPFFLHFLWRWGSLSISRLEFHRRPDSWHRWIWVVVGWSISIFTCLGDQQFHGVIFFHWKRLILRARSLWFQKSWGWRRLRRCMSQAQTLVSQICHWNIFFLGEVQEHFPVKWRLLQGITFSILLLNLITHTPFSLTYTVFHASVCERRR